MDRSPDCTVNSGSLQLGTQETTVCDTSVNQNSGCGVVSNDPRSYGMFLPLNPSPSKFQLQICKCRIHHGFTNGTQNVNPPNLQAQTSTPPPAASTQPKSSQHPSQSGSSRTPPYPAISLTRPHSGLHKHTSQAAI